ncbi:RNA binding protein [Rhodotorula toruloides]|uniref:RNA binding protein n=1 Tax=Rhodotorula toruloides TaxID=5286 RepID=A0A511KFR1_RHOTO|nr:RNA binding protein [Rhodotorula toruloides]
MSDAPAQQSARKLTKREKKALEFRAKKKGKAVAPSFEDEVAVIDGQEEDGGLDAEEEEQPKEKGDKASKKRKRDEESEAKEEAAAGEGEVEQKKKKRQRGKTKVQREREAREAAANGEGGEGHHRLLLFVGNMPYTITVDEIKKHFEPCGEVPTVRLLTPRNASDSSPSKPKPTSKGCAFLEFTSATALQSALRLHHSTLSSRKINVELTAGGGGNSATRRAKIEEQRKKLNTEREKAAKNKRLKEGESEDGNKAGRWKLAAEKQAKEGGEGAVEAGGVAKGAKSAKKVRDRRLKPGAQKDEAAKQKKAEAWALKASTGANAIKLESGWGNKAK